MVNRITTDEIAGWPRADSAAMPEKKRRAYLLKESAIVQYAAGATHEQIVRTTHVSRQHLAYLVKRCRISDPNGNPVGFPILVHGTHTPRPRRNDLTKLESEKSASGCLQALFEKYPTLRDTMHALAVFGKLPGLKRKHTRIDRVTVHNVFLKECISVGVRAPFYPFNTESEGASSLARWCDRARAKAETSKARARQLALDSNPFYRMRSSAAVAIYDKVECDGHYVDGKFVITSPSPTGEGTVQRTVNRVWLVPLLEERSTAVLGYSVAFGDNYGAADVARAVQSSLRPWRPRKLSISTITYRPGECLPNALMPELAYVRFGQLWLDNALSQLSDLFLTSLEYSVGATPVFGPVGSPNARPRIENLFDLLAEAGIHKMDGTTGSHPRDSRRDRSIDNTYFLTDVLLLDLIDLLICRYNASRAPGSTQSRLEILQSAVQRETTLLRRVPLEARANCAKYDIFGIATIGKDKGLPVLRWRDARYYGPGLFSAPGLIGKKVVVSARSLDLVCIEASVVGSGLKLGELKIEKRWSEPHSLQTRATIRRAMTNDSFLKNSADIVPAFKLEIENQVGARASKKLARLLAEKRDRAAEDETNADAATFDSQSANNENYEVPSETNCHDMDIPKNSVNKLRPSPEIAVEAWLAGRGSVIRGRV